MSSIFSSFSFSLNLAEGLSQPPGGFGPNAAQMPHHQGWVRFYLSLTKIRIKFRLDRAGAFGVTLSLHRKPLLWQSHFHETKFPQGFR